MLYSVHFLAQVIKQAITMKHSRQNVNSNQLTLSWQAKKCSVRMNVLRPCTVLLVILHNRSQERLPRQALLAKANGKRPVGQPRTICIIRTNYNNRIRILNEIARDFNQVNYVMEVLEDHEVWWLNLKLLPRNPHGKTGNEEKV